MENKLKGYQLSYLRGLAHPLKPVLLVGQKGVTATVVQSLQAALDHHELVKIKFIENKAKAEKLAMVDALQQATRAHLVGMVGHTVTFYRPHPDVAQRQIQLPQRHAAVPDPR